MIDFMHAFNTVVIFCLLVAGIIIVVVAFIIEAYDRITGADAKRQAQLERLRELDEDEDGMYPR